MGILQIASIGVIAALLAILFKSTKPEFSVYISLGAVLLIFYFSIGKLELILETIDRIRGYITLNTVYIDILLKIVGIAYISEFASQLCKDAGYNAIASQIEVIGKLSILAVSLPILLSIIDTVSIFLS